MRLDRLGEDLCLVLVWDQNHDDIGFFGGFGNGEDLEAFGFGLGLGLGAFGQADAYVNAGVTQRQRVRVALGAVTNNGYFAVLQQCGVGVVVIIFFGHESVILLGGLVIWSVHGRSWICRRGQQRWCRSARVRGCQRARVLPVGLPASERHRLLLL